jgi:hypothetical protein
MTDMTQRTPGSTIGQRMAVALVAAGLGSVIFGLVGFTKHKRDASELDQLARQCSRPMPSTRRSAWPAGTC